MTATIAIYNEPDMTEKPAADTKDGTGWLPSEQNASNVYDEHWQARSGLLHLDVKPAEDPLSR
jgi:hypothetical protein